MNTRAQPRWLNWAVFALLLSGLGLRLYNLNWDDNHHVHPDERFITMVAMDTRMPDNLGDILNPRRSPLNPYWNVNANQARRFAYGSFPLYLLRLTTTAVSATGTFVEAIVRPADHTPPTGIAATILKEALEWRKANDYDHINLVGRVLSAIFDTITLGLIFVIGRRIFNASVGLWAMAFVTFNVQHIQLAHFYAFDIPTTTVIVAAIYFGIRVAQDGKRSDSLWLGAMVALAIASKFSAMPLLLVLVMAHGLRPWLTYRNNDAATLRPASALGIVANPPMPITHGLSTEMRRALLGIALSVFCGLLIFAVVSPFTFLDFKGYSDSIGEQSDMVRGILDYPYTRQYRNTGLSYWLENYSTWALGLPLAFAAYAGFVVVIVRCVRRTATAAELLMLSWVIPYSLITLSFQVKFLRYLVPLTPFMCLMAAYGLWRIRDWIVEIGYWKSQPNIQSLISNILLFAILASSSFYALAFMQIYTAPLTRVQASEWIYRHIPAGKQLSDESWDDSLPLSRLVDGRPRNQGEYKMPMATMHLHEPDDARKLTLLKQWVNKTDYIILSSNRMYGWIDRLADRFPIVKRYYELLFAEQLGFKLVAEFTSRPRLGSFEFNDDRSDESFTVYDHPRVLIYQKTRPLSDAEWATLFAAVPPAKTNNDAAPTTPATTRDKTLLLDRPVDQLPAVHDRAWNPLARASQWLGVVSWWLVVELLGLLALPLTAFVFQHFADGGYAFSKALGLLIVAYLVWIAASLQLVIQLALFVWFVAGALLVASITLIAQRRALFAQWQRERRALILIEEALFTGAFLIFIGVRLLNPDLWQPWQGGEKSMEFAFLNAILRSPYFPPYDPYFAGGYINYYYYGIYLVGVLIKLAGVAPEVAFNLAIPTLFALTAVGAFGVAYNLRMANGEWRMADGGWQIANRQSQMANSHSSSAIRYQLSAIRYSPAAILSGLLAALFIVALGNLDGFVQFVEGFGKAAQSDFTSSIIGVEGFVKMLQGIPAVLFDGKSLPPFDYWRSSRVIPFTINEFPLWSFLFADLHPHMIGIPFTLLVIALALHAAIHQGVLNPTSYVAAERHIPNVIGHAIAWVGALALTLGAVAAINTWDAPTYFGLGIGVLLLRRYWVDGLRGLNWLIILIAVPVIALCSLALYWPFFSNYKALFVGLGVTDIQTDAQPFLKMWGFFLFIVLTFLVGELVRRPRDSGLTAWFVVSKGAVNAEDHMVRQAYPAFLTHEAAWPRAAQIIARHFMRLPRLMDLQDHMDDPGSLQVILGGLLLLVIATIALVALGQYLLAILLWPLVVSVVLLFRRAVPPPQAFINWLVFWALGILVGVEVVYLKDFLGGGEWKRMNTLFKFYIQVWVLLGLVAAVALPVLWQRLSARRGVFSFMWQTMTIGLLVASLIFTFIGTAARVRDRFPDARPPLGTLDGLAFMSVGSYTWPNERNRIEMKYDLDAIHWLNENVVGTPVIAEAAIGYYREGGMRVASYTGLPSLLGMHQSEQRYSEDVGKRDGQAREFFNTRDSARAMQLIRELHIGYIYLGQLEYVTYEPAGLAKFEQMEKANVLEVVYQNPRVKIYRVNSQ
jgi:YYY domain-containing protein